MTEGILGYLSMVGNFFNKPYAFPLRDPQPLYAICSRGGPLNYEEMKKNRNGGEKRER